MSDPTQGHLELDPSTWTDKPQAVVDAMIEHADRGIIIDGSASGKVSAQVAQLLLAGQAYAESRSTEFRIENISDAARSSLEMLGVATVLLEPQP